MEIVYALHVTTSSCNRMGSSGNNKALFSLLQEISVDSYRHSTWIFNCVVFFSFSACLSGSLYCFLGSHRNSRRCRCVLYWAFSMNSSPIVALVTRKAFKWNSQLSCEAFPKTSSGLLFINFPELDIWRLLEFLNVEPSPLLLSKVVHKGLPQVCGISCCQGELLHCVAHSTHGQTLAEEGQDRSEASRKCLSKMTVLQVGTLEPWHPGTEPRRILGLSSIRDPST